jgi:hypothetical protein
VAKVASDVHKEVEQSTVADGISWLGLHATEGNSEFSEPQSVVERLSILATHALTIGD